LRIRIPLADPQQDVLPGPCGGESEVFFYDEVVGLGTEYA
jgi:hypothetical protein